MYMGVIYMGASVFYIAVLLILALTGIKLLPKGEVEHITADDSTRIKGILCVTVLFHHFSGGSVIRMP